MSSELTPGIERKVRSIHDLIESKQYKKALKQVNTFLKKSDNLMLVTMKSYILQRLGEDLESFNLLESVVSHKPISPNILDLVTIIYKGLNRYDRLNQIYAEGFAKNPTRETGENLFNSYASVFNFTDQYQIALKLYKTFADTKYGILAVESMCLIAMNDPEQKKLLDLAGMFFNKVKQGKDFVNSREMVEIEIFIETLKGKDENVVQILQKNRDLVEDAVLEEAELENKFGNHVKAANLVSTLFDPNELTPSLGVYLKYIEFVMNSITEPIEVAKVDFSILQSRTLSEGNKSALLTAYSVISELATMENTSRNFKRTSFLALLFLIADMLQKNYCESSIREYFLTQLSQYILNYYEIPSVIEDIKKCLEVLNDSESLLLISSISSLYDGTSSDLTKALAYLKVCYKFSKMPDLSIVYSLYTNSLIQEAPPKKGEHRLGDQLIMMLTGQFPINSFFSQVLLEQAIPQSPYNYFLKVKLIEVYSNTGFTKKIPEVYDSLNIKSVQHESLSHLVFAELNDWRLCKADLGKLCNSIEKFHRFYALDLAESTKIAYLHNHIEQVLDFARFKATIDNSLYFHMTEIAVLYMEMTKKLQEGVYKTNTEGIHKEITSFTDTIDVNVMNDYLVIGEKVEISQKKYFGRWTDLKFFDFERAAIGFVCEICAESEKVLKSYEKMSGIVREIEGDTFFVEAYALATQLAEVFVYAKGLKVGNIEESMGNALGKIEKFKKNVENLKIFQDFQANSPLDVFEMIADLKKIAFFANTFAPLLGFILNFCKKNLPAAKKSKKAQKNPCSDLQAIIKSFTSQLFSIIDTLSLLQSESFLTYIDSISKTTSEVDEILVFSLNKVEKVSEITQTRRFLLKDLSLDLHSTRAALLTLFR